MKFEFKSVEELKDEKGFVSYGKFGLNKAVLKDITFEEQGEYGPTMKVEFSIGEGSYISYLQPTTKVWKEGIEIPNNHPDYKDLKDAEDQKTVLFLNQLAEAVGSKEAVIALLNSGSITDMISYFKGILNLIKSFPYSTTELDLFLQYQYSPAKNQTKTFLEVPKPRNLRPGSSVFVVKGLQGNWKEQVSEKEGLSYVNESGEVHPIKRTAYFMTTPYSKQTESLATTTFSPTPSTQNTNNSSNDIEW